MARIAVSNSSPLIILHSIGRPDLMTDAFDEVLIPPEVAAEVRPELTVAIAVRSVINAELLETLVRRMDRGEAAAIALAYETRDSVVVLDDKKGRTAARSLGLTVMGTLGLIVSAKKEGRVAEAKPLFDQAIAAGLFISRGVLERGLYEAGESPSG